MTNRTRLIAAACAVLLAAPASAWAHMPYLLPGQFELTGRDHVTVQAGFTEDAFIPDVVMKSDAWSVRGADGVTPITKVTYLRDLAVFEVETPKAGAYRISSGVRMGRKAKMYKAADGQWLMVGEGGPTPAGVEQVDVQSVTVAEVYVSKGEPTDAVLSPSGKGLELRPITHPNRIFAGEAAKFELLYDGKPLAGARVEVYRSAGVYDGRKALEPVTTDPAGRFSLTAPDAGTYMTLVRHRGPAPAGSETPYRSYSHSLTFEATQ
ncbi:DUF4198 domain-containing protein [Caulobacter mirabilis]|uniref:NAD+ synthetase n=1 Tax=Caulobacter mirabilis TaxID=69666 RepID=A0A2D2AU80_9CAUL|nr:DUF4198 domain-containing protein [Caulobacter mirabilis]ATQ41515.1 NAD+ synthetase [Caulobacter mirabilis]